jgi:hypothetical protein
MITLKTITTIELSSACNLACKYCVNRLMKWHDRSPKIMDDITFHASLEWLHRLCDLGTQQEVNLNGNGESLLDPQIVERTAAVIKVMGNRQVSFCTNGMLVTEDLLRRLQDAGLKRMDVSAHRAYHARRTIDLLNKVGMQGVLATGAIVAPHNWAGQIEPEHSVTVRLKIQCDPLIEGRGYIQAEGDVVPCCYDYRSLGKFGHVYDEDLLKREIKPYSLCFTCHQIIPQEMLNAYNEHEKVMQ